MKRLVFVFAFVIGVVWVPEVNAQTVNDDFFTEYIMGEWYGELKYPDPQSSEMVFMPVKMAFQKEFDDSYVLDYNFNNDPQSNIRTRIEILDDGEVFANANVISTENYCPDELDLITETEGLEENIEVKYIFTYYLSDDQYEVRKEVIYPDSPIRQLQNEYCMYRKNK